MRRVAPIITCLILYTSCTLDNDKDVQMFYDLQASDIASIEVDVRFINGEELGEKLNLTEPEEFNHVLSSLAKTEQKELTEIVSRYTTSSAHISIKTIKGNEMILHVGILQNENGYTRFNKKNGHVVRSLGMKHTTEFSKSIFDLVNSTALSTFNQVKDDENSQELMMKFYDEWLRRIRNEDISGIGALIEFPLKNAQFIAQRYDDKGLSEKEFVEAYDIMFDSLVLKAFLRSDIGKKEIPKVSEAFFEGKPAGKKVYSFQIDFAEDTDGMESSMIFFFWEENSFFKLRHLELVG